MIVLRPLVLRLCEMRSTYGTETDLSIANVYEDAEKVVPMVGSGSPRYRRVETAHVRDPAGVIIAGRTFFTGRRNPRTCALPSPFEHHAIRTRQSRLSLYTHTAPPSARPRCLLSMLSHHSIRRARLAHGSRPLIPIFRLSRLHAPIRPSESTHYRTFSR
jgi:hypothetical protein